MRIDAAKFYDFDQNKLNITVRLSFPTSFAMDVPNYLAACLALSCLLPVHAEEPAVQSDDCASALVQVDDKGVLSANSQCGLSKQDAKIIENALFQLRHDLKPSTDQMRSLLAANNLILGAVLERLNAGEVSLDGVLAITELLANMGNAKPSTNLMFEAGRWKDRYENLMVSLEDYTDKAVVESGSKGALQRLNLDQAAYLFDELIAASDHQDGIKADAYFLRAQVYLLQFQPQQALPLLEKARQLRPDNKSYNFAYASALQAQDSLGSAESLYTALLEQYRNMAKDKPAMVLPNIAATLNNLGLLYSESKRPNEAEKAFREAVEIQRDKLKDKPAALALTLNNLANFYRDNNRLDDAAKAYQETLDIRKSLARETPAVYQRSVAATLTHLANIYRATKRPEEAEKSYLEALGIARDLVQDSPMAYRPDLAATLSNLGILYGEAKRPADQEKVLREARDLQRELARGEPSTYEPNLAATAHQLGNLYSDANRMDEAEKAYREALEVRGSLAKADPTTYQPQVAITLNNLALIYRDTQRFDEAEKAYSEAIAIQRELYRANPESNAASLKTMLSGEAVLMEKAGRPAERAKIEAERATIK